MYTVIFCNILQILVKIVSWVFPSFNFQWLVDETKRNIPKELDFRQEANNTEKVRHMFSHLQWLKVIIVLIHFSFFY